MIFSSLTFLCVFLPVVFLLYLVIPPIKGKNALLIIASLLFYAYGEPVYVLLMLVSTVLNYLFALLIGSFAERKKVWLVLSVVFNLGILSVFKYTAFLVESCNHLFHLSLKVPEITLPVGISFFTFQATGYPENMKTRRAFCQKTVKFRNFQ